MGVEYAIRVVLVMLSMSFVLSMLFIIRVIHVVCARTAGGAQRARIRRNIDSSWLITDWLLRTESVFRSDCVIRTEGMDKQTNSYTPREERNIPNQS